MQMHIFVRQKSKYGCECGCCCYTDIPNLVADTKTDIQQFLTEHLTLYSSLSRILFFSLSQIRKLNFDSCWCSDMFYYPTFFKHQHFRTELTNMWVQFKLKDFVLYP